MIFATNFAIMYSLEVSCIYILAIKWDKLRPGEMDNFFEHLNLIQIGNSCMCMEFLGEENIASVIAIDVTAREHFIANDQEAIRKIR